MRVIRFEDERGRPVVAALQPDGSARRVAGDVPGDFEVTDERVVPGALLPPVVPTNILCIGRNYHRRPRDGEPPAPDHPIVFMKATTAVQAPGAPILLPRRLRSDEVIYESELAVVIGAPCRNVDRQDALRYVLGYTCANDLSARDWQDRDAGRQWWRGKSFDTFAPLGPCLVTPDEMPGPAACTVRAILNGRVTHQGPLDDLIFDVPDLIAFLSSDTTLLPGTVILTGCPPRIAAADAPPYLQPGDTVSVEIDGIGRLSNPVAEVRP
jgi:2-keto-4-pentenoate hydratase/2-oxohepta-3-ene-1,7-dioic acid hydratase in catechol pathway